MKRYMYTLALMLSFPALAQQAGSPFAGFSEKRDQPINFEADRAEVFDQEKKAVLTGRVKVIQGESTLTTNRLVIWYEDKAERAKQGASDNSNNRSVKRFDMEGQVKVTSKDQIATSDKGVYDARKNEAVLTSNVILTQCNNIMRGERLHVDLKTNQAKLTGAAQSGGRVSGLLTGQNTPAAKECATNNAAPKPTNPRPKI
jgi:lipopolysaccharide export system protein LptA